MTPILVPVTSSNLLAVGYDPAARTLYVAFRGTARSLYAYDDVPPHIAAALMTATSHGEYLNRVIKGAHPYRRLLPLTEAEYATLETALTEAA